MGPKDLSILYNNNIKVFLYSNKALCQFCKQSFKNFRIFRFWGPSGGPRVTPLKKYIYKNTPVKKYIIRTLMCSNAILC